MQDQALIIDYFEKNNVYKLHLGCGSNRLQGWLNSDFSPQFPDVFALDVTQAFPIESETFDFVFSEHMIEHISLTQGMHMLEECYRILKPNGKIRVSTPDLAFLIDLYRSDKTPLQKAYIEWATNLFSPEAPMYADTYVINNFVRNWGHTFIYDEKTLHLSLLNARFKNITKCEINQSSEAHFCHLENESRMPEGFLKLETMTLEGTKL